MADKIASYVAQKGLPMYSYFINGQQFEGMSSSLQQDLMQHVFGEQQKLGQLVQVGVIKFKSNVYGYMTGTVKKKKAKKHTQQFAYSKYDARVFDRVEYLPLVTPPGSPGSQGSTTVSRDVLLNPDLAIRLPYLKPQEDAAPVKEKREEKEGKEGKDIPAPALATHHKVPVTHWVVADFCTAHGQNLLRVALDHYNRTKHQQENQIRMALLHRGDSIKCLRALKGIPVAVLDRIQSSPLADIRASLSRLLPPDLPTSSACLITNGRLIRLGSGATGSGATSEFDLESFAMLEKYERMKLTHALHKTLVKHGQRANDYETVMRANSLLSQYAKQKRTLPAIKPSKSDKYYNAVSYQYQGRQDMQVVAVLDPLSVSAQRVTPTLLMLRDVFNMSVTVFLNPSHDIQEFPLKNFYRFVPTTVVTQEYMRAQKEASQETAQGTAKATAVPQRVKPKDVPETTDPTAIQAARDKNKKTGQKTGQKTGKKTGKKQVSEWGSKERAVTKFVKLPKQHVLTLKLVTPESWVAMKYKVEDDLDNIRLDDQTMGTRTVVNAEFRLTSLLIAGNCNDLTHYKPPNGLQLVLRDVLTKTNTIVADTLVMQNLGYYQLRTQPGQYRVALAEGRASTLYAIAPKGKAKSSRHGSIVLYVPTCP